MSATEQLSQQQAKQEMMLLKYAQLKLKRTTEQNNRLKDVLSREKIYSSSRAICIINYTQQQTDYFIPSIWGTIPDDQNKFKRFKLETQRKKSSASGAGCCVIT
ncbi:hypothetical protein PACTADRAFT_3087 [Pachysolen tannophilus NRRL Y-2460]|uniref:G protein gamma domain-containing protein n=1 Tax=Pachysolen tannophilus NRRL Y-2460 TaxID=669874 RepID=A0A1E4TUH0_PACTA|nr:hypothetical protein PACTADRAFT_3087 [Pachysolen tannophilus NRRL Y-2460]